MQQNIFLHLQTAQLKLRPFGLGDLYLVARILQNPKVVFWRKKCIPLAQLRTRIEHSQKLNKSGLGWWLIFDRKTDELIGSILLQPLEGTFEIEIGYHILPEHWGKGYGSEAARRIVNYAFEDLDLPRICAVILPRNARSLSIIKKLDFIQRGILLHANFVHRYFKLERQDYIEQRPAQNLPKKQTP